MGSSRGRFAELATRCLVLAIAAGLGSCRDLEVPEPFPCSTAGNCPEPYRCGSDDMCRLSPVDGGVDAASGRGGSAGGRGGAAGSVAGSGGSAGTGGVAGSVGPGGTGGSAAGTGGTTGTGATGGTTGSGGTGGTGGGTAGRGGTGGSTAGTGGTSGTGGGTAGRGGTGGSSAGTGGAAGRGGQGGTAGTGGTGGSGGTADTTRPQIVDVAPFNGQTGVASNAKVVVTFSEAMNQTAVRNAYSSSTLLAGQVTFGWNGAGTILTITPNNPLPYAFGDTLTLPATAFSFQISTAATDLAGNGLAATFSSSFTTLRRITSSVSGTNVFLLLDSTPNGPSEVRPIVCMESQDLGNTVGRSVSLAFTSVRKLYITLQIPAPPPGVTAVETAVFRGLQTKVSGDPYSLSVMTADEIPFQTSPDVTSNTVAPLRSLGTFSTTASTVAPQVSVTATFAQWFPSGGGAAMIRLQFGALPSVQALAYFSCTGFLASWTYLVP